MPPTAEQIEARMPVWEALSEFFLDTELTDEDYTRIVQALAASPFSVQELENILVFEVRPACRSNLLSVAGKWSEFDRAWIREKIAPHLGRRPLINLSFRDRWMYRTHWAVVRERVERIRNQGSREQNAPAS